MGHFVEDELRPFNTIEEFLGTLAINVEVHKETTKLQKASMRAVLERRLSMPASESDHLLLMFATIGFSVLNLLESEEISISKLNRDSVKEEV